MVKLLSLLVVFVLSVASHAQDEMPQFSIEYNGIPQGGYYLAAPISRDSFGFIDKSGRVVFQRSVGLHTNLRTYQEKRLSVFTGNFGFFNYVIFDSALVPIDTMVVTQPFITDSHEGQMWSDSTFMMLGLDFRPFDMSAIVQGGQPNASLMATVIQERHLTTDSVLFEWNAFGRIPVTDATSEIELRQRTIDYIHANSIARDSDGNLIVSCRHLDEVIKIRRSDGSIAWRLGGLGSKNKQFTILNDNHDSTEGFSHQHSVYLSSRGTLVLFDNGNLKPIQRSRVVEYALDTTAMTATRVWSYVPEPPIYCPSQGSVRELPNGNLLIGYSATDDTRIAEEVDRNGTVIMQMRRSAQAPLQVYRVSMTTMGCTSVEKKINSSGRIEYSNTDSTTAVSVDVAEVDAPVTLQIERHHYRPHEWLTSDAGLCGPLSMRWTLRCDMPSSIRGGLRFDAREFASPTTAVVYFRPTEGSGSFQARSSLVDAQTNELVVDSIAVGEYAVAYPSCVESIPVSPRRGAVNVMRTPMLRWSEAPDATGYDVQASLQSDMSAPFLDATTARRDTTLGVLPVATDVYWRVRKRNISIVGLWSEPWTFRTVGLVDVSSDGHNSATHIDVQCVDGQIQVRSPQALVNMIKIYDLLGSCITSSWPDPSQDTHRVAGGLLPRVVLVRVQTVNGSTHQRIIGTH
jgi:hypothetical protein